jgi:hypothetical protein
MVGELLQLTRMQVVDGFVPWAYGLLICFSHSSAAGSSHGAWLLAAHCTNLPLGAPPPIPGPLVGHWLLCGSYASITLT